MTSKIIVTAFSNKADQGVTVTITDPDADEPKTVTVPNGSTEVFEFTDGMELTVAEDVKEPEAEEEAADEEAPAEDQASDDEEE